MTTDARPAATVVLARATDAHGAFEVFLVRRRGSGGFFSGAHVFPGGRVDDDDQRHDGVDAFAAAAVRETFEEAAVLLARHESGLALTSTSPKDAVLAQLRAGAPFSHALVAAGLVVDKDALTPLAWWITPVAEPKRFDTRFFFATVPAVQRHDAVPDGAEVDDGLWLSPKDALDAYAGGRISLAPPTLVTLEELAPLRLDDVRAHPWPQAPICPVMRQDGDTMVLALPGDPWHDEPTPVFATRTRVVGGGAEKFRSARVSKAST